MKSPHGQPSPALVGSIHRPYLRHNAEETGGGLMPSAQKTGGVRVSPAQPQQNASLPIQVRRICFLIRLLDLTKFKAHRRGATEVQARNVCAGVRLRTTWKPLLAERK
jgi:hypothetical protein